MTGQRTDPKGHQPCPSHVPRRLRPDNGAIAGAILHTQPLIDMDLVDALAWLVLAFRGGPVRNPRPSAVSDREADLIAHLETAYYQARTRPSESELVIRQLHDDYAIRRLCAYVDEVWERTGAGPLWSEASAAMHWSRSVGSQVLRVLVKRQVLQSSSETRSLRVSQPQPSSTDTGTSASPTRQGLSA